jgi:hypothetical protein
MTPVATYGDTSAFNVKIYSLSGGYYVVLNDGSTPIFQRFGMPTDIRTKVNGIEVDFTNRFAAYTYDSSSKVLTLSGASNSNGGVGFTCTFKITFVAAYVVKDSLTIQTDTPGGAINFINWNVCQNSIANVWTLDNTNAGTTTSTLSLGIGVTFNSTPSVYGCIGDNQYNNGSTTRNQSSLTNAAIACVWVDLGSATWLMMTEDQPVTFSQWFFRSNPTMQDFTLQAQLAVAVSNDAVGSSFERVMQAVAYLNTHQRTDDPTLYFLEPSNFYPRMYARDSFWHGFVVSDTVEQSALSQWEAVQQASGKMPTSLNSDGTVAANYYDEGTMLHLIREYYDTQVRGLNGNMNVMQQCVTYLMTHVTNDQYRANLSSFQMWNDDYIFNAGDYCGYSQGIYCVALQCALALGLTGITEADLTNAIAQYQALYSSTNQFMQFVSDNAYLAPDVLVGEALSIRLFNTKLLTDQQVADTLNRLIAYATTPAGMKCLSTTTGAYLNSTAFNSGWSAGDYQNGGSWFLYEYLAYWAGIQHGHGISFSAAKTRMAIEFTVESTSHEYLQTAQNLSSPGSCANSRQTFSWNAAATFFPMPQRRPV